LWIYGNGSASRLKAATIKAEIKAPLREFPSSGYHRPIDAADC
jgi:hypothetical protein